MSSFFEGFNSVKQGGSGQFLRGSLGGGRGRGRGGRRGSSGGFDGIIMLLAIIILIIGLFKMLFGSLFGGGEEEPVVEEVDNDEVVVETVNSSEALELLDGLDVVTASGDYDRSDWKHWIGSPCNTRQEVLIEQGDDVVVGDNCKVESGSWVDPYSLEIFTNPGDLDIDHLIPLGYASRVGGSAWSSEVKEEFANDFGHLYAVSARENRAKGDKGPSGYLPPNEDFWCEYAGVWVETSSKYGLGIIEEDKEVLENILEGC